MLLWIVLKSLNSAGIQCSSVLFDNEQGIESFYLFENVKIRWNKVIMVIVLNSCLGARSYCNKKITEIWLDKQEFRLDVSKNNLSLPYLKCVSWLNVETYCKSICLFRCLQKRKKYYSDI